MGRGSSKAGGSGGGGASIVRTTIDRRTGQIYKARRGEIIVSKDGRDLLVRNARLSDAAPGGVIADYSARVGGKWVELPRANQSEMSDYARAALRDRQGTAQSRTVARLDQAAENVYRLQTENDRYYPVGRDFVDRQTGKNVPRERIVELRNDLRKAKRRFNQLLKKAPLPASTKEDLRAQSGEGIDLPF